MKWKLVRFVGNLTCKYTRAWIAVWPCGNLNEYLVERHIGNFERRLILVISKLSSRKLSASRLRKVRTIEPGACTSTNMAPTRPAHSLRWPSERCRFVLQAFETRTWTLPKGEVQHHFDSTKIILVSHNRLKPVCRVCLLSKNRSILACTGEGANRESHKFRQASGGCAKKGPFDESLRQEHLGSRLKLFNPSGSVESYIPITQ